MLDMEKVIKGLEECSGAGKCQDCVYGKEHPILSCKALLEDALELLKEYKRQEGCPCTHCMEWECDEVCDEYKKWKNS